MIKSREFALTRNALVAGLAAAAVAVGSLFIPSASRVGLKETSFKSGPNAPDCTFFSWAPDKTPNASCGSSENGGIRQNLGYGYWKLFDRNMDGYSFVIRRYPHTS